MYCMTDLFPQIRAIYRIAEYAGGENGYLLEHEM